MLRTSFLLAAVVIALTACADNSSPVSRPPPSPEEEVANGQPQEVCYNQCLQSSGAGGGTAADRSFCRERCTY